MAGATAVLRTEARLFIREPGSVFGIVLFPPLLNDATLGVFPDLTDLAVTGGWAAALGLRAVVAVRRG
jgi:hypothetical protein